MRRPPHSVLGLSLSVGLATLVILAFASAAQAQYYQQAPPPGYGYPPPPPPPPRGYGMYRSGLTLGAGIGIGGTSADTCGDSCGAGFGYEVHIGGMLTPQLALLFDISGVEHSIANTSIETYNTMYLAAVQFFPINALWFKAGIGLAHYTETDTYTGDEGDDTGKAIMIAAGYEVYQAGPFALDLQLRLGDSFYTTAKDHSTAAFLVGFNWY
jgi:hypothetical protein